MSAPIFQPYGLIETPIQHRLYDRAYIQDITSAILQKTETMALMGSLFRQNIFADRNNFVVSSQQPPFPATIRLCNFGISYLDSYGDISTLCFAQCKGTSSNSLRTLERQVEEYCTDYLASDETKPFVYAATMDGTRIRLWIVTRTSQKLHGMWGNDLVGDWSQYKDVGRNQDAQDLLHCFEKMKAVPPSARAGQSDASILDGWEEIQTNQDLTCIGQVMGQGSREWIAQGPAVGKIG